jgi:hypothetical protein
MRFAAFFCYLAVAFLVVVLPAGAQEDHHQAEAQRTQDLVGQLDSLITKAERERTADRQLLQELRDLVRRFDSPWQKELLYEDFSDGDFRRNPTWTVSSGDFRIDERLGLTTRYAPATEPDAKASPRKEGDLGTAILGVLQDELQKRMGGREEEPPAPQPTRAEIYTELDVSNAFVIDLKLISRGGQGQVEFGPYQQADRSAGYRLVYRPGQTATFELLRVSPDRSAVIESVELNRSIDDAKEHNIEWRRGMDGTMAVSVDGDEVLRTQDLSFKDPFDGFLIVNQGGLYSFPFVKILGTEG